jgi:acyl dehydratase
MKSIKDFYVGQTAELMHQYSENDVNMFAEISGDHNPIHLDAEYAKESIFGKKIVFGFLSGSLISAVLGNVLPGEGSIYMNQTLSFLRPVFIGDTITAKVVISEINEEKKRILLDTVCTNQNGKTVIEGTALMYYPY